jgi:hypothetical protein
MDNKIFIWGTGFRVNGDIGDSGVFKNVRDLSLGMSVLHCVVRCLFASDMQFEV